MIKSTEQVSDETSMKRYWPIIALTLIATGCGSSSSDSSPIELDAEPSATGDESSIEFVDEFSIVSDIASNEETEPVASGSIDTDLILTSVLSLLNTEALEQAIDSVPFECPISGTVITVDSAGASGGTREYSDCEFQGALVNGRFRRVAASAITLIDFEELSIVREDSQIVIERGSFEHSGSQDQNGSRSWSWVDTVFSTNAAEGSSNAVINEVVILKEYGVD